MNRRSFLSSVLQAGVGAAILPAAVTYARAGWKRIPVAAWESKSFVLGFEAVLKNGSRIYCPTASNRRRLIMQPKLMQEIKVGDPIFFWGRDGSEEGTVAKLDIGELYWYQ